MKKRGARGSCFPGNLKKKGISHIEIILSFIIFVVAVGFALYFFSPFNSSRLVESSLSYSFREISNNVSVVIETYAININNTDGQIGSVLGAKINGVNENDDLISRAEDVSGQVLSSRIVGDIVLVSNPGWGNKAIIFIKLSTDFDFVGDEPFGSESEAEYYEIASSESDKLISEKRFINLQQFYLIDYAGLKKEFNLPNRVNWGFSLAFDDISVEAERTVPSGLEVFSEIRRVEALRDDGKIDFADLSVGVW